MAIMS